MTACRCDNSTFDGHVPDHKHSVPKQHGFRLFQVHHHLSSGASSGNDNNNSTVSGGGSSRCVIQVEVLQASRSGEHKVKVMELSIKTWVNVADAAARPHASALT